MDKNEILKIESNIFKFNRKFIYIFEQVNIYRLNRIKTKVQKHKNYKSDIISN